MGSGPASYLDPHAAVASTEVKMGGRDGDQTILYQSKKIFILLYLPPLIQGFGIFPYSLVQNQGNYCRSSDLSQFFT